MDFNVVDNFLGVCDQKVPINMDSILNDGGAVFYNSPKRTVETP